VLFLVLRPPEATIVKVQQLRQGNNGRTLVRLYLNSTALADAVVTDSKSKHDSDQTLRSKQLENPSKSLQLRMEKHERVLAANRDEHSVNAGKSPDAATAGSTYGSLTYGDIAGSEVRPALWISGPNPEVAASEFAEGLEGSVVVEITIDDQGNVVRTDLLQSLAPAVDTQVIAALQAAHFIPAKRNGVSIPSKQDVYYHFPR
jgi:TonB family protein